VLDACLALLSISALGLAVGLASAPAAAQDKMGKDGTSNGMAKDAMSKDGMKKTDAMSKGPQNHVLGAPEAGARSMTKPGIDGLRRRK
jgi:pentapeptide MXKDX repeat protein